MVLMVWEGRAAPASKPSFGEKFCADCAEKFCGDCDKKFCAER